MKIASKIQFVAVVGLYTVAALLAGAHFLRAGSPALLGLCLLSPLLFLYRKRWILMLLQAMAYGAAVNWIVTACQIVQARSLEGRAWTTAAVILGAVAAVTAVAGLLLNSGSVRTRYPR
ncbi:MAG: hypothetical protein A3G25_06170 [Betaproteobacteria bacterium RIFCSPLOWO2_12_FULL_63_13]|nr:MAG: hypothetical protein A3G25_06170 [Betaproteobacteria bacterium RIFCSPLOWO2_12_FULL_63_13]